jgi:hypothetical protein
MRARHGTRWRERALVAGALIATLTGLGDGAAQEGDVVLRDGRGVVPARYFGLHIHSAATDRWPTAPFATWRLWGARVAWPSLQPARGKWSWDELDRLIALAEARRVEPLLPLGLTPGWASARPEERSAYGPGQAAEPADLDDWRRYVEAVVARYKGRVRLYEIWNEPNLKQFYSGSIEDMVRMCRDAREVIKRADPRSLIVSPSATKAGGVVWLDRFLAAGGAGCFDVVGFHFYVLPDPPERLIERVADVRRVMAAHGIADRPLWNTEAGWYIAARKPAVVHKPGVVVGEADASAFVARAMLLARAAGIDRFYWYAWDNYDMGLVERDGAVKPAGRAFAEVQRWLVGAELVECRGAEGTWICPLARGANRSRRAWAVWSATGSRRLALPRAWRAAAVRELDGRRRDVAGRGALTIGPAPLLVEGGR